MRACRHRPLRSVLCWQGPRRGRRIAITFDDGPDREYTPRVLEILDDTPATFFLLGLRIEQHPDLCQQIVEAGHEIGVHGYDHSLRDLAGQTRRTVEILTGLGVGHSSFRPPRGTLDLYTMLWMASNRLTTVLWSFDSQDSMRHEGKSSASIDYRKVRSGDIVLMHDDNPVCVAELPELLEIIHDKQLAPTTVSGLFEQRTLG